MKTTIINRATNNVVDTFNGFFPLNNGDFIKIDNIDYEVGYNYLNFNSLVLFVYVKSLDKEKHQTK